MLENRVFDLSIGLIKSYIQACFRREDRILCFWRS